MTHATETTLFGILRHGQTVWNTEHRVQGSANSPLTENGKLQTANWAKFLQTYTWHRLLVSDQGRAQQTATIINELLDLPVTTDSRLREQCWGDWEGLTLDEIKTRHAETLRKEIEKGWEFRAPGGESRLEVKSRVESCLQEAQQNWQGRNILVICHQGVIKCLLYSLTGRAFVPGEDVLLQHNSLHFISCRNKQLTPEKLNVNIPHNDKI